MNAIHFGRHALLLGAGAALLAGCANAQPPLGAAPQTISSGRALPAKGSSNQKDPWLYVSGNTTNNVAIYDLAKHSFPKIGAISTGVSSPGGIALDKKGNLYVANTTGSVTIYAPGSTSPTRTLTDHLSAPESVALAPSGDIYVCNRGGSPSVVVFHPGKTTASSVITDSLIQVPAQIQFDSAGDMFYADNNTGVSELPAGSSTQAMFSLKLEDLQRTDGVVLDPTDGNLFVSTFGNELDGVRVFAPHFKKPIRQLEDSAGDDFGNAGSINGRELMFIPDHLDDMVKAFRSDSRHPAYSIDTGAAGHSTGVAFKPGGVP
jgi:sugar lactone lactonase YvrE